MNDFVVSIIRTWVPILVGALLTWLSTVLGAEIETAGVAGAVVSIVTAAYYALARWLEGRYPWAGLLLGYRTSPTYPTQ